MLEHRDIARAVVELLLRPKQLEGPLRSLIIIERQLPAQRDQFVAAIFGKPYHAALVERIVRRCAVSQHRDDPSQHRHVDARLEDQRGMFHEQRAHGFQRDAWRCPGRRITRRDFPGIGEACLERWPGLPVDEYDLMTRFGQIIGRRHADDAGTQHDHSHAAFPSGAWRIRPFSMMKRVCRLPRPVRIS